MVLCVVHRLRTCYLSMVVVGCSKRSGRDKDVSFYKLSKITASKGSRVLELSKKRRAGYIKRWLDLKNSGK